MSETSTEEKPRLKANVSKLIWHVSCTKRCWLLLARMINAGEPRRFIMAPTIGQIIDVFQSVLLGINNAAEKPYIPTKGST